MINVTIGSYGANQVGSNGTYPVYDTLVSGTADADNIWLYKGSNVTIDANAGDDTLFGSSPYLVVYAGDGNDTFSGGSNNNFIDMGDGNDYVSSACEYSTIKGGNGNDNLHIFPAYGINTVPGSFGAQFYRSNNTIVDGGEGDDYVFAGISSANSTLIGGNGKDTIFNRADKVIISGGNGDDLIENGDFSYPSTPISVSISAGDGNDSIYDCGDKDNIINAGLGDDYISVKSGKNYLFQYVNGDGKDTIYGYDSTDTIQIAGSSYSTKNSGTKDILVNVSTGSMLLVDAQGKNLNIVTVESDTPAPTGGMYITNYNRDSVVSASSYNDTIINDNADRSTINAGDGDDTIRNTYSYYSVINAGAGNDTIFNGYKIDDVVNSGGQHVIIDGGAGDDFIVTEVNGEGSTLKGGTGNDTIYNAGIILGVGYSGAESVTIDGGDDNDYIYNQANFVSISGGAGNDTIINYKSTASAKEHGTTINAGAGDDIVSLNAAYWNTFYYANGDGNDTIYNFNAIDTIKVAASSFSTTNNGDDLIVKVGEGSLYIIDGMRGSAAKIVTVQAEPTIPGPGLTYVKLTNKDKSPYNAASGVGTISGAEERTKAIKIVGNDNSNVLIGGTKNDTLVGGDGVDTFVSGAGKDYVTDYVAGEVVSLTGDVTKVAASGKNVTLTSNKGTMILTGVNGKKVTFVDANGNTTKQTFGVPMINVIDGDGATINTANDAAVITVDASTRTEDVVLIGNSKANTIIGGSGDDELTGGKGKDVFVYNGGNDIITDYKSGEDTIKLDGVTVKKVEYVGESNTDLCMTFVEGGTLTIENVIPIKSVKKVLTKQAPQKVNIITNDGIITSQIYNLAAVDGEINTMSGGSGVDSLYGFMGDEILYGGKGKDKFIYSSGNDTITDYTVKQDEIILNAGNANNYTVVGDDAIFTVDSNNSLTVNNVLNKTIKINGADVNIADPLRPVIDDKTPSPYNAGDKAILLDASKRKKAIEITANSNDNTIISGKGNDTFTGGEGADTFVYTTGYGNDVIKDYSTDEGDIIRLGKNTAITGVSINRDDMILTVGKGKITIEGGASQTITIIDDNNIKMTYEQYRPSSGYMERWFLDNAECRMQNAELDSIINSDSNLISNDYNYNLSQTWNKQLNQTLVTNSIKQK